MRDRDRWWWLIFLTGLAFGVGGVAYFFFVVRTIPTDNPYITSADYWQLIGLGSFGALVCLGGGATLVAMGINNRRRHRLRLAAFRDNTSTMPLADMRLDPTLTPDVAEKPLDLVWRIGTATRVFYIPLLGLKVLILLISIGLAVFTQLAPVFYPPQRPVYELYTPPQPMSVGEIAGRVTLATVLVAVLVVLSIILIRAAPFIFGRPFGLSATNVGIDARTEWGSRMHMAWEEMLLLEVVKGDAQAPRRFALYAPGKRIDWAEYTVGLGGQYAPVDITSSEMTLRQASLPLRSQCAR